MVLKQPNISHQTRSTCFCFTRGDDELAKKMSTVELIVGGRKLTNDDSTVSSEGLTEESMVTVLYSIKVIECKEQTADSPESLLVVKIPEKEETIPMAAFEGCESLVKVMMPEVKEIRKNAFKDCGNLTILEIGDHTTRILANAFANCRSLITVDIKGKVISLQDFAFGFCSSMTEVTIPGSLLTIGADLFFGCTKLVTVKMPGCNLRHISAGCFRQCKALKKFIVPESVTSIDDLAFAGCIALEDIQIPESVTKIGRRVFKGCVALAEINLPKTVKHLGEGLFHGCTALEAFIVSDEVGVKTQSFMKKWEYNTYVLKLVFFWILPIQNRFYWTKFGTKKTNHHLTFCQVSPKPRNSPAGRWLTSTNSPLPFAPRWPRSRFQCLWQRLEERHSKAVATCGTWRFWMMM